MAFIREKLTAAPADVCQLAAEMGVANVTAAVLLNRGIRTAEEGERFLFCKGLEPHDPFEMLGMYEAVDLITEAVEEERQIALYGDYDVDGVTSVCIMYQYLTALGAHVQWYIPDRFSEGYGLNKNAVAKLAEQGVEVLIALDCGITSVEEIAYAKELMMDVLVVDHHTPPEELPDADVIVNPKQPYCEYPFKELCTAGLALKLVEAHGGMEAAKDNWDIAALGTVADMVPLLDENRFYVKNGLEKINTAPCVGIKALKLAAGYGDKELDARGIAFGLAPRLNAAGRLAHGREALAVLLAKDLKTAVEYSERLNVYNDRRRGIEQEIYRQAVSDMEGRPICEEKILVVDGKGWNKGVVGLAASHLTEKFSRPTVVLSRDNGLCTGSARSVRGFNIYNALASAKDLYTKFGGHSQAAGLSLPEEHLPEFRRRLAAYAEEHLPEELLIPTLNCECRLSPADIDRKTAGELMQFAPFGMGNEEPLFVAPKMMFENVSVIGKDKNVLKAAVAAGGKNIDCIGFGQQEYFDILNCSAAKTAVYSVSINIWQHVEKVQLKLEQVRLNLRTQQDIDAAAASAEEKLFACLAAGTVQGDAEKTALSLDEAVEQAAQQRTGGLILTAGGESLRTLLERLAEKDLADRFTVYMGCIPAKHDFGANAIVVLPEKPILPGEFSRIFASGYVSDAVTAGCKEVQRFEEQDPFRGERHYDRTAFAAVYKRLQVLAPRMTGWTDWQSLAKALGEGGVSLTTFGVRLMLKVFAELDFIRIEETETLVRFAFAPAVSKKPLTESALFVQYSKLSEKGDATDGSSGNH